MKHIKLMLLLALSVILLSNILARSADSNDEKDKEDYLARLYGVVESMPEGGPNGIWTVNDREILVTEDTAIEEEFGKTQIGAYVEIEGEYIDKTFTAYKIEVKKGNKIPGRE
ncbi:MAG: DUF5666 domain-containing protein [Nitrospirota bacterium]